MPAPSDSTAPSAPPPAPPAPAAASGSASPPAPLPVRRRADLVLVERRSETETRWTVKDPVAMRFFELGAYEHFVLTQLDGTVTAEELESRYARLFAPQRLDRQQVLEFVGRLWQLGLLTSLAPGGGTALYARRRAQESPPLAARIGGLLSFRIRGFDPDRLLGWLHDGLGWMFSPWAIGLASLFVLSAVLLVAMEFEAVLRGIPDFQSFLNVRDVVTGAVLLGGIKVLHELGHGLTCKHFGGECHELGFLWLVMTPALYCNVSDAWLLPSRWQRAAVSGAGIFVELVLAALFTFLWFFSEPGNFHDACFWGMTIGSVNTLLINGNPLLRYDGYYVLSDLLDIPNLRARSQRELGTSLSGWVFGIRPPRSRPAGAERGLLLAFGLASWLYGWVVLIAILWFLYHLARPVGLDPLVVALALAMVAARALTAVSQGMAQVRNWRRGGQVRTGRFLIGLGLAAAAVWGVATWPFPHTVRGPALLVRAEARTLFIVTPGFLETTTSPGPIAAGEPIALLSSPELRFEILKLQGAVDRMEAMVESLTNRVVSEPHLSAQLAAVQASLLDQKDRLKGRQVEAERLRILAPAAGEWWPMPIAASTGALSQDPLLKHADWSDPRLRGAWIPAGTRLAELAPQDEVEARVFIDQSDLPFVRVDQPARLRLPQAGSAVLHGRVREIAARNVESVPPELALRKQVAGRQSGSEIVPQNVLYEVRIAFDGTAHDLVPKGSGEARIEVGRQSLWRRFLRFLSLTFRIREAGP